MSAFDPIAARLIERARQLAAARAAALRLVQADPAARWRQPALLWPLFTKG